LFSFLAKTGVKEEIINFDAHRITPESRKKVAELLKKKEASFNPVVRFQYDILVE
jgi:dynein heavy chain 2